MQCCDHFQKEEDAFGYRLVSEVSGFQGFRVQEFKGSKVQRFKSSKVQEFKGLASLTFGSGIQACPTDLYNAETKPNFCPSGGFTLH